MKPLSLVHIARRFARSEWGGTETVLMEVSRRLAARGHVCEVLCPAILEDKPYECIFGVPVRRYPYFYPYIGLNTAARRSLDHKGGNVFSFALQRALAERPRLDLIHLHTGKRIGGIGRLVARRRHIPYVVSLHGGAFDVPAAESASLTEPAHGSLEWGKLLGWWVGSRRVLEDAAAVVCVGKREKEEAARRLPSQRIVHLPNGVEARRFARGDGLAFRARHAIPREAELLLAVGRIDPQKNQLALVRSLPTLLAIRPNLQLLLVGATTTKRTATKFFRRQRGAA